MPTYEYYCPNCRRTFELKRGVIDASLDQPCPRCGWSAVRRLSTGVSIVVK